VEEAREAKPRYGIVNFERRRYPRYTIDLPIEYCRESSGPSLSGRAINASEGGLLIYFPEKVEIGEVMKIRVFFSLGQELKRIEMVVQVVWIDLHPGVEGEDFRSGVRFIDIPSSDLIELKNFLKGLSG
jgi:c-di-GMP-binding flagellar brake protein YcgR